MRIVTEDVEIKLSVLHHLRGTIVAVYDDVPDMNGDRHRAIKTVGNGRTMYFRLDNGLYIGDDL